MFRLITTYGHTDLVHRLQKQLGDVNAEHSEAVASMEDKYKAEMQSFKQRMAALEATSSELQKEVLQYIP